MSCIGKFQSPDGLKVSGTYYTASALAGSVGGRVLYESSLSDKFINQQGFDWSQERVPLSLDLTRYGEPRINTVLNFNNISLDERIKGGLAQIEDLVQDGWVGKPYSFRNALDRKVEEINLNPRFKHVDAEVTERNGKFWLRTKAVLTKPKKPVSKNYLEQIKFLPTLVSILDKYGETDFKNLIDTLLQGDMEPFQRQMLERFQQFITKNPTLKVVVFSATEEDIDRSFFDPHTNTMYISKDPFTSQSNERLIRDVIHEAAHAYTLSALNNPQTAEERKFKQEMEEHFQHYSSTVLIDKFSYGMQNVEEFTAEFMSNPYFRQHLESIDAVLRTPRNPVQRILQSLRSLFRSLFGFSVVNNKSDIENTIEEYLNYLETLEDVPNNFGEEYLRFASVRLESISTLSRYKVLDNIKPNPYLPKQFMNIMMPEYKKQYDILSDYSKNLLKEESMETLLNNGMQYFAHMSEFIDIMGKMLSNQTRTKLELYNPNFKMKLFFDIKNNFTQNIESDVKNFNAYLEEILASIPKDPNNRKGNEFDPVEIEELKTIFLGMINNTFPTSLGVSGSSTLQDIVRAVSNHNKTIISKITGIRSQVDEEAKSVLLNMLLKAMPAERMDSFIQELEAQIALWTENLNANKYTNAQGNLTGEVAELTNLVKVLKSFTTNDQRVGALANLIENRGKQGLLPAISPVLEPMQVGGVPIVQLLSGYLDTKTLQNSQEISEVAAKLRSIHEDLRSIRPWTSIALGRTLVASFYKNIVVTKQIKYIENGEIKTTTQAVLNTKVDWIEFNNQKIEKEHAFQTIEMGHVSLVRELKELQLQEPLDTAAVQAKAQEVETSRQALEAAKQAYDNFLAENVEDPYVEEFYQVQDLIDKDSNGNIDQIGKDLRQFLDEKNEELSSLDHFQGLNTEDPLILNDIAYDRKKEILREIKEKRNAYKPDGTLKSGDELEMARRLQAYYKEIRDKKIYESSISPEMLALFNSIKDKFISEIDTLSDIFNAASPERKDQAKARLQEKRDQYQKWLKQYTRRQIKPEFYDLLKEKIDAIQAIYNSYPEMQALDFSDLFAELNNMILPKRDEDGIPDGTLFTIEEANVAKQIEMQIDEIRKKAEESANISKQDKKDLKRKFQEIAAIRERNTTSYYAAKYDEVVGKIQNAFTRKQHKEMQEEAKEAFEIINKFINGADLTAEEKENVIYAQALDISDIVSELENNSEDVVIAQIYQAILQFRTQEELRKDSWYVANHITESFTDLVTNNFSMPVEITVYTSKPIRIWVDYIPTNPDFMEQNAPNGVFSSMKINEAFKNPKYKGPNTPKESKFLNQGYANASAEEKSIIDRYADVIDDMNKYVSPRYQIQNYQLPTQYKSWLEINNPVEAITNPMKKLFNVVLSPIWGPIKEFLYPDLDQSSPWASMEDVNIEKGEVRPRKKYKDRMSSNDQSFHLTDLLLQFSAHAIRTKNLVEAIPETSFGYQFAKESSDSAAEGLKRKIFHSFYGQSNLWFLEKSGSKIGRVVYQIMDLLLRTTGAAVLAYNFVRFYRQWISQTLKAYMVGRKNGLRNSELLFSISRPSASVRKYELESAIFRAHASMRTLLNLKRGITSKSVNKKVLLYIHYNFVPGSESSNVYSKGVPSLTRKYLSIDTVRALSVDAADFVPAAMIAEVFLHRKYKIGNKEVKVKDFHIEENGVLKYNPIFTAEEIEQIKVIEDQVRNDAYGVIYEAMGQYHTRSRSTWESNILLKTIFFLQAKWYLPGVSTMYGGTRISMLEGKVKHSVYFSNMNLRLNLLKEFKFRKAIFLNLTKDVSLKLSDRYKYLQQGEIGKAVFTKVAQHSPARSAILTDIFISTGLRYLTRALTVSLELYLLNLATAGGDDEDKGWLEKLGQYLKINVLLGAIQADAEYNVLSFPGLKVADAYNTYIKYKPYVTTNQTGAFYQMVSGLAYMWLDQTTRSIENRLGPIFEAKTWTDPLGRYEDYSESHLLPKLTPRKIYTERTKEEQELAKKFGVELPEYRTRVEALFINLLGLTPIDNMLDPERKAKMFLQYGGVRTFAVTKFQEFGLLKMEAQKIRTQMNEALEDLVYIEKEKYVSKYSNAEKEKAIKELKSLFNQHSLLTTQIDKMAMSNKIIREYELQVTLQGALASMISPYIEYGISTNELDELESNLDEFKRIYKIGKGVFNPQVEKEALVKEFNQLPSQLKNQKTFEDYQRRIDQLDAQSIVDDIISTIEQANKERRGRTYEEDKIISKFEKLPPEKKTREAYEKMYRELNNIPKPESTKSSGKRGGSRGR